RSAQVGRATSAEVLPPCQGDGLAAETSGDAFALGAPADHRKPERIGRGGEQLVVLAEAEVLDGRAGSERNLLEVELDPATGTVGGVPRAAGQPVRDVRQRVGDRGETSALVQTQGRSRVALLPEGGAGGPERAGHDDEVARLRAGTTRHSLGAADR